MTSGKNHAGFTLLEVSIAAGIMVIAFVVIMQSIVNISMSREIVAQQMTAEAALSSVMERLRTLPFDQLLAFTPLPTGLLGATEQVRVALFDANGALVLLPVTATPQPIFPNPVEVQVTVFWIDPSGKPFSRSLSACLGR